MTREASRGGARGFTLLEVMVAVAILGLGLTTIFAAQAGAFASAGHARNVSVATGLVRCKMSELETTLKKDGFQELDQNESGPCCDGDDDSRFSCNWRVEKLELPEEALGKLDLDSDLDLGGSNGPSASKSGGSSVDPLELAASAPSGALGLMGLLSKGKAGAQSDIGEVATTLAGDDADGAMGGIAEFVMTMVYPDLRRAFVEGTRRATVTIVWNEGSKEHAIEIAQWIVDARAAGLRVAAEGEFEQIDEEGTGSESTAAGAGPGGPDGGGDDRGGGDSRGPSRSPFGPNGGPFAPRPGGLK
jgi:general secretion pathway protein I